MEEEKKQDQGFWFKVASFIVDKRKAIEILFIIAIIYSVICMNMVDVNQDITSYLPDTSETRIGLDKMEEQFTTYATVKVMISNITYDKASVVADNLAGISGVKSVEFDNSEDHYKGTNALISITVDGGDEDKESIEALDNIESELKDYDVYISTAIGEEERTSSSLDADMNIILVCAVAIIVFVLALSTKAYAEIPVLLITFGTAALLNKGTNYWFGTISSVTNSIAVVLQLALAIDYAIILCDRYMEEHETMDSIPAVKVALSKAIPEISSSSLTTVSGMAAMMFMQFRLGYDMGIVLVKAIIISLISVFFLMPGIILIFSKAMDKTRHKCNVPNITFVGKFASATKWIIPPVFVAVIVYAFIKSNGCLYLYDVNSVESAKKTPEKIATEKIDEAFGTENQLVVMVPVGDYESEKDLLIRYEDLPYVSSALGLANQKINDDYVLTDALTPRQFAELIDLDVELVNLLYSAYAYNEGQYGPLITDISDYSVPIIDMFMFLYDQYTQGYVTLSPDMEETLNTLYDKLYDAELQLKGEEYTRLVLTLDMPVEGDATYEAMDEIRNIAARHYGEDVILVGNSTSTHDLQSSFANDNLIISILTALFVLIILLFTFQSAGLPLLLVLTIQGSIWINFTVPSLQGQGIYFLAYLIVSAIQMGATIDYAIVISSRYLVLKKEMPLKKAVGETINQAFPTIFTSGTILTCAGFLIGYISSNATIAAIGIALGRGTLISIILVIFVLPQILLLGDWIIEKTALTISLAREEKEFKGRVAVSGHIRGYVTGMIDADVTGIFTGDMKVAIDSKIPGRSGQVTDLNDPKQIEQKDDVIGEEDAEMAEIKEDNNDEE